MTILDRILEKKRIKVEEAKKQKSVEELRRDLRKLKIKGGIPFYQAIKRHPNEPIKLIAEIKKASPTKGKLKDFDVEVMSDIYVSSGADAISVITEEDFFLGSIDFLIKIKNRHPNVPVLRKDFIFDEYQIYESKAIGADAILLIAAILSESQCKTLYELAKSLDMDVLFEVHDEEDLNKAFYVDAKIIGINNRNLKNMQINLETTFKLKEKIPNGKIVVSESGISKKEDVLSLAKHGIDAILVGTSLILSDSPEKKIKELKLTINKN